MKLDEVPTVPQNVVITAAHGSYEIPNSLKGLLTDAMTCNDRRLQQNFSDHATALFLPKTAAAQTVIAKYSRAVVDLNRSPESTLDVLHRTIDFNGNKIWKRDLRADEIQFFVDTIHKEHREAVQQAFAFASINRALVERVVGFFIHDTGNCLMDPDPAKDTERDPGYPNMTIGTRQGASCSINFREALRESVIKYFDIKPIFDVDCIENPEEYQGSYEVAHYGATHNKGLSFNSPERRNVVEMEFGRYLYMDEKTQTIDEKAIFETRAKLAKVITAVADVY